MAERKRILIVDDEEDILMYLSTLLQDHGYETRMANDGVEAWKKVEEAAPDLITLDISMPEKSGIRFYRDLKTNDRLKGIPIIIVTGVSDDFKKFISSRQQVPAPEAFISKPIDRDEILKTVERLTS